MHPCHIPQADYGVPDLFDGNIIQLVQFTRSGIGLNHPVKRANPLITGGQNNVLAIQRA